MQGRKLLAASAVYGLVLAFSGLLPHVPSSAAAHNITVTVPAIADIALAGQPNGTLLDVVCRRDSATLNSPVNAGLVLTPGQAVQFTAVTGAVDILGNNPPLTSPNGDLSDIVDTAAAFGLSAVRAPAGALVGVFLGPDQPNTSLSLQRQDFSGAAREIPVLTPLLQQPFYIGQGRTSEGATKSFIIPSGAARLFLGVVDEASCNSENTGSFSVTAILTTAPPPAPPGQATVFSVAEIGLAGQPGGTLLDTVCRRASAPLNSPVSIGLAFTPGQAVQFASVTGAVDIFGDNPPLTPPNGNSGNIIETAAAFGLSAIRAPAGALIGVFLGNDAPANQTPPPTLDFSTQAARDQALLTPVLHQVFYVGQGRTSAGAQKRFIVPSNATRLFLAVFDETSCGSENTGAFQVSVATQSSACPAVSGISPAQGEPGVRVTITGAGFTGVTAIRFTSNVSAAFTINSDTQIFVTVPGGAATGAITISKTGCNDALTTSFTIASAPACPTVSSISPASGSAGATVTITGANLTGVTAVRFANNSAASFTIVSNTQIRATVPGNAVTGPLTISKAGCGDVQTGVFTINNPDPTLTSLAPQFALAGGPAFTLTVTGTKFIPASVVRWRGGNRTTTFVSETQLRAEITAGDLAAAGTASVTVFNPAPGGGASNALTFTICANCVRIVPVTAAPGSRVSVPIELLSAGEVNAVGLSLSFSTSILKDAQAERGRDAAGATLNVNTSQAGQGRLGLGLALPAGQKFPAGARLIAVVTFTIAPNATAKSALLTFTDQPVRREVVNASSQSLPASYLSGTVAIEQCYEADVAPRPTGDGDGTVKISDWVQLARFAAGLDAPAAGSEFQRADGAPRNTLGDGVLSVADWAQAGRYAVALDPVARCGGPATPSSNALTFAAQPPPPAANQQRAVRLAQTSIPRGQQGTVTVECDAQGNENALGFSVSFDQTQLKFISVALGSDTGDATYSLNDTQAASGRIGLVLAFPGGRSLSAGTRRIINLTFEAAANGAASSTALAFGDQPIRRELVNTNADVLPAAWTSGTVIFARPVASVSAASFSGAALASESIAAAFGTALATATQAAATTPLPTSLAGTTVKVRDSGASERLAPLFFASPTQINYLLPAGTAVGPATVTVTGADGALSVGNVNIAAIAPGLFTASADGQGLPAAVALRIKADGTQSFEAVARFDPVQGAFVAVPIDLGATTDQVFLLLFGTGLRFHSGLAAVTAQIGGVNAEVTFAGAQGGLVGLDQINLRLPRALAGRGEVDVMLTVDGKAANTVRVAIK